MCLKLDIIEKGNTYNLFNKIRIFYYLFQYFRKHESYQTSASELLFQRFNTSLVVSLQVIFKKHSVCIKLALEGSYVFYFDNQIMDCGNNNKQI